jgi:hypothetical protein
VRATLPTASKAGGESKDFQEVSIVGEPKVGKLLVASGDMPAKVCPSWVRQRPSAPCLLTALGLTPLVF